LNKKLNIPLAEESGSIRQRPAIYGHQETAWTLETTGRYKSISDYDQRDIEGIHAGYPGHTTTHPC